MKKTIVFIIEGYYPNYSAVGICAANIIHELTNKYNIITIAKKNFNDEEWVEYNNHYITHYTTKDNDVRNSIDNNLKTATGIKKSLYVLFKNIVRGRGFLGAILRKENINNQDVKAIYNKLKDIQGDIDLIIPTCLPIESIIASIKYKNSVSSHTKIAPILFDKFSENSTLHRIEVNKQNKYSNHLFIEKTIFEESDWLLHVESWKNHIDNYLNEYKGKIIQIEHPLIKRISTDNTVKFNSERINIVYTGALYRKLRSPLRVLEVFEELIKNDYKIVVHFYITGDCDSIILEYSKKYPHNIMYYGKVRSDIAKSAIVNANILLSIGNTDITQLPSKIFEYISTGNPIIHFFTKKEDPAIKILDRYKNALCINSNDSDMNIEANVMEMFGKNDTKINFIEIEDIYKDATPKYTADIIIDLIESRGVANNESTSN